MKFDWGMHYFRGFAILAIIVHHILLLTGHEHFADSFTAAGTIFFLFISGYLCQYLDTKRRVTPTEFYEKKFLNVLAPYYVFSTLTLLAVNLFDITRPLVLQPGYTVLNVLKVYFCGRAQGPYWYIPFVTLLFFISPRLVRLKTEKLAALTLFAFLAAAVFPKRTITYYFIYPDFINLYFYFTWPYLLGMVYARTKTTVDPFLARYQGVFLLFALLIGLGIYHPGFLGFEFCHRDFAIALQKLTLGAAVLALFNRLKDRKVWILDKLATYSFTLFFTHMIFIPDLVKARDAVLATGFLPARATTLLELVLSVAFLALLTAAAAGLKAILGARSRFFIGS